MRLIQVSTIFNGNCGTCDIMLLIGWPNNILVWRPLDLPTCSYGPDAVATVPTIPNLLVAII